MDVSDYTGFVIYRETAEYCGPGNALRLTPDPLAFGQSHTIPNPAREGNLSYRYEMRVVTSLGEERSPYEVCEFIVDCLGFAPPIAYEPGPLGYFLGSGYLSGSGGSYEFESCGIGCPMDCSFWLEAWENTAALDAIAEARQPVLLWGEVEFSSDWCSTVIQAFDPAACVVPIGHHSWGSLKGRF